MADNIEAALATAFLAEIERSFGGLIGSKPAALSIEGQGSLPSVFATTDLAVASVAAAGRAAAEVVRAQGRGGTSVAVDRRLASLSDSTPTSRIIGGRRWESSV